MNEYKTGELWRDLNPTVALPPNERIFVVVSVSPAGIASVENVSRPTHTSRWAPDYTAERVPSEPVYLVDLDPLLGREVRVDLTDGSARKGTLTRVEYGEIEFLGMKVRRPDRLVWDQDGSDWMTWDMFVTLTVE